jgi:hypothetical protein
VVSGATPNGLTHALDEAPISRFHLRAVLVSGMGFFTDAYDLFIIGVVMALLMSEWKISPTEEGLVASTALLASAFGAILFGRGRRHAGGVSRIVGNGSTPPTRHRGRGSDRRRSRGRSRAG